MTEALTVAALVEDRRRLRTVLDHLPAMVGYWGSDLRNRVANRAYVDWFGRSPEELEGRHISELLGPELYAANLPFMQEALAGRAQHFDRAIVDPQGTTRWSQASYIPDVLDDGTVDGFFVLVADITPRVRAEQALAAEQERTRRLAEQLRVVSRVSATLHDLDPDTVQKAVGEAVLELGYDGCALVLVNRADDTFLPVQGHGILACAEGVVFPAGVGSTQVAVEALEPVVVADYQSFAQSVAEIRAAGLRTTVSVPVRAGGRLKAVMHAGWSDVREVGTSDVEVLSLLADIAGTALANARRYGEARASEQELTRMAETDPLTGVGNRLAADRLLAATAEGDVLVVVDLDLFKRVNDQLGHAAGDDALRALGACLQAGLRQEDAVARLGGEEFVLRLPGTDLDSAETVLQRLRDSWLAGDPVTTFSAGAARAEAGEPPRSVYERADTALYQAKEAGRDRYVLADA
ncbi:MAG: sensor domain-containing diguanylate cyclase [Mycobacteriales bacterium]